MVKEQEIVIDHVELEKRVGNVIPDVVVYANEKPFFVEIYVTHAINKKKLEKLKEIGISTIEVDLSEFNKSNEDIEESQLKEILLGKSNLKYWAYHAVRDTYLDWFYKAVDKRYCTWHCGYYDELRVYNCPISNAYFHGVPYAVCDQDCFDCSYRALVEEDSYSYVLCFADKNIRTLKDLKNIQGTKDAIGTVYPAMTERKIIENEQWEQAREVEAYEKWVNELQKEREKPLETAMIIKSGQIIKAIKSYHIDTNEYLSNIFEQFTGKSGDLKVTDGDFYNYDSFLRSIVKEILTARKRFPIPALATGSPTNTIILESARDVMITSAELMPTFSDHILNLILHFESKSVYFDLFTEQEMTEDQIGNLRCRDIPVVSLNLSSRKKFLTLDLLLEIVKGVGGKYWRCHPLLERDQIENSFNSANKLQIEVNGRVTGCPHPSKSWKGVFYEATYSDFYSDCKKCPYYAGSSNDFVFCVGHTA